MPGEFKIVLFGREIFRVLPFVGAGWAWPYCYCKKWQVGFYFHCGRGLYIGFGWDTVNRRMMRAIKAMTQAERDELRRVLSEALERK